MAERSKNKTIRRRSLNWAASCDAPSGAAVGESAADGDPARGFAWATSSAGTASTFSTSKESTFCGLLSSRIVKFSGFNPCTKFPFLSRTVTFTSTRSDSDRNRSSDCCCEGKGVPSSTIVSSSAAALSANRLQEKLIALLFSKSVLSAISSPQRNLQKRKRDVIVNCRMAPAAVTRPNVGEVTEASIEE